MGRLVSKRPGRFSTLIRFVRAAFQSNPIQPPQYSRNKHGARALSRGARGSFGQSAFAFGSAPASSKISTHQGDPSFVAKWSGVHPLASSSPWSSCGE